MGVSGSILVRVRTAGADSGISAELRFTLQNSVGEFAEFEPADSGVYRVTDWKSSETDNTLLTLPADAELFEITNLDPGEYTLIPLDTDFITDNDNEFVLLGEGKYQFTVAPNSETESTPADSANSEETALPTDDNAIEPLADLEIDYANKNFALPETGGIGTAPFYIIGGVIAAASAVILIARFRKKK